MRPLAVSSSLYTSLITTPVYIHMHADVNSDDLPMALNILTVCVSLREYVTLFECINWLLLFAEVRQCCHCLKLLSLLQVQGCEQTMDEHFAVSTTFTSRAVVLFVATCVCTSVCLLLNVAVCNVTDRRSVVSCSVVNRRWMKTSPSACLLPTSTDQLSSKVTSVHWLHVLLFRVLCHCFTTHTHTTV